MKWLNCARIRLVLVGIVAAIMLGGGSAYADFTFGEPTNLGPTINRPQADYPGSFTSDGLEMYFDTNRSGPMKDDIYVSRRATIDEAWGAPVKLGPPVNSSELEVYPIISRDGLSLYFTSFRADGYGALDMWVTTRETIDDDWGEPSNLGPKFNGPRDDIVTSISSDGLVLHFYSRNRPAGYGGFHIWVSTRQSKDADWSEPMNLGPTVNSSYNDSCPYIPVDGLLLFFYSNRPGGFGNYDLYMTTRSTIDDDWGIPVNLGPTINSSALDYSATVLPDGSALYFGSERLGGSGGGDIWQAPIIPIVDFNGDGIVDSADMVIMVDNWGTDNSLCDIGPMPWGDGVVDVEDLKVLAEHLFEDYRLIHHWKLDEDSGSTAHNSVGDVDAALHGAPHWQPFDGILDGALTFDGQNDYLTTPFVLDPAAGSFSVFVWIKGTERGRAIISQDNSRGVSHLWLGTNASNGGLITRLMHPTYSPLISEVVITDGQWHHVGLVYDLEKLHRYLYIDGVEVAADSEYVGGVEFNRGLYVGVGEGMNPVTFWSGTMDDIRIYNNVLSADEIAALAQ